ncbi:MAG TPA: L-threonylcarbamoyladenylate synthase [Candidatus Dormibacteraeota bacterium]|jgi:L-threonylcarbamoyladenylate synthase|nr:L-threonylcarbamoyladenylate synthase [Candidatus Dormibacteraeota bacterium]
MGDLTDAVAAIGGGGLVVFPTDTVFGLGCLAADPAARRRLYAVKRRDPSRPAILMAATLAALEPWVVLDDRARELAGEFWPGALTLVLPVTSRAAAELGEVVQAEPQAAVAEPGRLLPGASPGRRRGGPAVAAPRPGTPTLAVRIPDHPVALALLHAAPGPLATSSANRAGEPAPTTLAQARAALGGAVDAYLDGEVSLGVASSILDLAHGAPRLIRQGSIPPERLLR